MNNRAKIYTYSIIYTASEDFKDQTPYVVAIVEAEGKRLLTRIEEYENSRTVEIGMEVEFSSFDNNGKPLYKFI